VDTTPLQQAYAAFLDAAATVTAPAQGGPVPPPGEWHADEVVAHVALVDAATLAATAAVAAGSGTTVDNRVSLDAWTLARTIERGGDGAGLRRRVRLQGEALCRLAEALGDDELAVPVPTLLVSAGSVLVDRPLPLQSLLQGLAEDHLPRHTQQLLALSAADARPGAA
jgi:hypothetical protein